MRIIKINPYEVPREEIISGDLKSLQDAVHGYIEVVHTSFYMGEYQPRIHALLLVNEEGMLRGMRFNMFDPNAGNLFGPVVICGEREGEDGMELCDAPITLEELKHARPGLWEDYRK